MCLDSKGNPVVFHLSTLLSIESEDGGNHQRIRGIDTKNAVVHKIVYFIIIVYICTRKDVYDMEKAFVYGMSVEGDNFTDRVNDSIPQGSETV